MQLVTQGSSKWSLSDLKKIGSEAKAGTGSESRGSSTELESVIEVQMGLVNLMPESSLKTELMGKLLEAKKNLEVDISRPNKAESKSGLVKVGVVPSIVGKSDFVSGILILKSIFPNFSEYFS